MNRDDIYAMTQKRLRKELKQLEKSDDDTIYLRPIKVGELLRWNALLRGPDGSPYAGGIYGISVNVDSTYPMSPPTIKFLTKIFHPNVNYNTGDICLDILKKEWSPAWSLISACRAVLSLMDDPEASSPLNCDAGNLIRAGDMTAFNAMARMYNVENAREFRFPPKPKPKAEQPQATKKTT
ncbi:hypothetical protein TrLO_g4717 [Triparma laevis f. longispina]|uniref:UBC core domain-containing protein n=1 Tax=Triparma laevis f. longispina TaxID=1714387 RepID=A0A9W7FB67_9STRA|nr:hypothetical protein TrLO_g4717 [Triparma laevis f. longispina]